jgi:hypothetical protein
MSRTTWSVSLLLFAVLEQNPRARIPERYSDYLNW